MGRRILDLSVHTGEGPAERVPVRVRRTGHHEGALQMAEIFGIAAEDLPDGLGWAGEEVTLLTHAGTHMDAPWHYGPTSGGEAARTIDQVPLEWCFRPGVVLDLRSLDDGEEITVVHLRWALERAGHSLAPGEIVLLHTGADRHWGTPGYPDAGSGLGREATLWLVEQGIRVIGTDAWGLDRPFPAMRAEYARRRDPRAIWPAHYAGREREYCQLEKLANLGALPPTGFTVACFPIRLTGTSAAWVRAVAIMEDE